MSGRAVLWRKRRRGPIMTRGAISKSHLDCSRRGHPVRWKALQIALFVGAVVFVEKDISECYALSIPGVAASVNPHGKSSDVLSRIWKNVVIRSPTPHIDKLFPLHDVIKDINANPDSLTV